MFNVLIDSKLLHSSRKELSSLTYVLTINEITVIMNWILKHKHPDFVVTGSIISPVWLIVLLLLVSTEGTEL